MMKKNSWVLVFVGAAMMLGGCEKTREMLGQTKSAPDEFAVYSRAPLSLPPDYGLRPPSPGTARPQSVDPTDTAQQVLVRQAGGKVPTQLARKETIKMTPGLKALLDEAGAFDVDPNIRTIINRETSIIGEEDQTFAEKILFWNSVTEYGTIVDAKKESDRIRQNQALGEAITAGETPIIERKKRALLEGLFD